MIIILSALVLFIIGILLARYTDSEIFSGVCAVFGLLVLFMSFIALPISHFDIKAEISKFESVEHTLQVAREHNTNELESAAFLIKVADWNEWLASIQYYNDSTFDLWIPDEIEQLKPLD